MLHLTPVDCHTSVVTVVEFLGAAGEIQYIFTSQGTHFRAVKSSESICEAKY